ncbi:MAG: ABC transporter ATP-binding protein [Candidatus Electrothrix sp. GM3_4]|nr:ABC transporter ATP-binding protein [Candidatus Electrothrix sp. GM3_4]
MTLRINGLSVLYQTEHNLLQALEDIDLEIRPGTCTALVGESGSGKSTLALACLGLLPKETVIRGGISLDGEEIDYNDKESVNRLRWFRVAIAFQNGTANLNPVHRVIEQVAEPLICRKKINRNDALQQAAQALGQLGLVEREYNRYPHQLSGGQAQRVLLAMALVLDPEILILDEPTSNLDAVTRVLISQVMRQATDAGKAILLITHDLEFAVQNSQQTVVLYSGQIMERLPSNNLLLAPSHPYTMALGRSYPDMERARDLGGIRGESLRRTVGTSTTSPGTEGCLFVDRCTQSTVLCAQNRPVLPATGNSAVRCLRQGIVKILELKGVGKAYKDVQALKATDLSIKAGEVFALIGETGSGKSTLSMIAAGLLQPDKGERTFDNRDMDEWIQSDYKAMARKIGVVYQNQAESFSHRFTIFDILAEPLRIHGQKNKDSLLKAIVEALARTHLPHDQAFLKQYPHQLNMGALQRLSIARALMLKPQLLIADEPTSSLDPSVQAKILQLLLRLQTELGLSMLFITHDLALARKVSDRIGVMLDGVMVECGPATSVLERPAHPYTKFLLDSARGRVFGKNFAVVSKAASGGCGFATRCDQVAENCTLSPPQPRQIDQRTVACHNINTWQDKTESAFVVPQ